MRRLAWLLFAAAPLVPVTLGAQYFGQNKVQYSHFKFKVLQTEHFDLYYYEVERNAAVDVARMAERSYVELSTVLRHQFRERKPIILYASLSDFQQTNTSGEEVQEGVGGFTDFALGFRLWGAAPDPFDIYYDDIALDTHRVGPVK